MRLLVIGGATGTGKSDVAVLVAERLGGEVISADSMQIYKGMNIGTAKITPAEMRGVKHHMIDVISPKGTFTVADYKREASAVIRDLIARGKVPVVCGGTGMYIHSLLYDMSYSGAYDPALREALNAELAEKGKEYMHEKLASLDPAAAARLHVNDVKRVVRAIEKQMTGGTAEDDYNKPLFAYKMYVLERPREKLYERINLRVDKMLAAGLREEIAALEAAGVKADAQSMQAIAYKEWATPNLSDEEIIELIKKNTRNYAKRQNTWFKQYKDAVHVDVDALSATEAADLIVKDYMGERDER